MSRCNRSARRMPTTAVSDPLTHQLGGAMIKSLKSYLQPLVVLVVFETSIARLGGGGGSNADSKAHYSSAWGDVAVSAAPRYALGSQRKGHHRWTLQSFP
jgi:hypothetical protein